MRVARSVSKTKKRATSERTGVSTTILKSGDRLDVRLCLCEGGCREAGEAGTWRFIMRVESGEWARGLV